VLALAIAIPMGSDRMRFLFEDFELDVARRELRRSGLAVAVEPQVLDMMMYLIEHRERVVGKDELHDAIWKGRIVSESTLSSRVNGVRKALADSGQDQRMVRTVARKGFRFVAEVTAVGQPAAASSPFTSGPAADGLPADGGGRPVPARLEVLIPPDKPSIAVLPFQNMSGDPAQEYFADGVVESITAGLSRVRDFFVIARNSAFVYKGQSAMAQDIGRKLGVAYLLEGSVQRDAVRIRVTVQLVETAHGAHLWAEKFDGAPDDIFDLQDRIAAQVAGALQPSIRQAEITRSRHKRPQELGAYDYTMRAISHVWLLDADSAGRGLDLLDRALEIDADYPLALALSAWCWAQCAVYNWVDDVAAAQSRALALADRAVGQSTDDPLVLAVLGTVHTLARNFGVARVMLERAIAIDPNAAWALSRTGWLEVYTDRPDEARSAFERAIRLSPLDPMNFNNYVGLASARQVACDDRGAAALFQRALQERPNALWIHRNLAPALLGAERLDEARASRDILLATYPRFSIRQYKDAMVFSPAVLERIAAQLATLGVPA
jgi:adenylate cyclase